MLTKLVLWSLLEISQAITFYIFWLGSFFAVILNRCRHKRLSFYEGAAKTYMALFTRQRYDTVQLRWRPDVERLHGSGTDNMSRQCRRIRLWSI